MHSPMSLVDCAIDEFAALLCATHDASYELLPCRHVPRGPVSNYSHAVITTYISCQNREAAPSYLNVWRSLFEKP